MASGYYEVVAGSTPDSAAADDYWSKQAVMVFASASARNTALSGVLREGMVCFLADTNTLTVYTGSAWSTVGPVHGALLTYTPTITQSATVTQSATDSRYTRTGRWVQWHFTLTCSSAGTAGQPILVSLPVTAAGAADLNVGRGSLYDASGGAFLSGYADWAINTSTTIKLVSDASAHPNAGATVTLATNDVLRGVIAFEAAGDA